MVKNPTVMMMTRRTVLTDNGHNGISGCGSTTPGMQVVLFLWRNNSNCHGRLWPRLTLHLVRQFRLHLLLLPILDRHRQQSFHHRLNLARSCLPQMELPWVFMSLPAVHCLVRASSMGGVGELFLIIHNQQRPQLSHPTNSKHLRPAPLRCNLGNPINPKEQRPYRHRRPPVRCRHRYNNSNISTQRQPRLV